MVWSAYCLLLESQQIITISNISPISRTTVRKKRGNAMLKPKKTLKTGEMLNMLNVFGGPLKKVLETGEMLNMLNVLNVLGEIQPKTPKHLTYLTFPLFRADSRKTFNISPVS